MSKTIETIVRLNNTENALKFFCIDNAEHIVGCGWYKSHMCMESCKFYKTKQTEEKQVIEKAKYWNRK